MCKYASFSKVGGNYPLDLKIIWSSGKRLFISYLKPYKRVTSTTIARWIKLFLIKCGITGFGAHSTRSASTICVFEAGLSVILIIKP